MHSMSRDLRLNQAALCAHSHLQHFHELFSYPLLPHTASLSHPWNPPPSQSSHLRNPRPHHDTTTKHLRQKQTVVWKVARWKIRVAIRYRRRLAWSHFSNSKVAGKFSAFRLLLWFSWLKFAFINCVRLAFIHCDRTQWSGAVTVFTIEVLPVNVIVLLVFPNTSWKWISITSPPT